jgi:regulatory protein
MKKSTPSLKVRALKWLAGREHSRGEMRLKLLKLSRSGSASDQGPVSLSNGADLAPNGNDPAPGPRDLETSGAGERTAEVDAVLDWLEQRGYLDNQRFVESRVRVRQQRYGAIRIEGELRQHGLELDEASRQALKSGELARAQAIWVRKFGKVAQGPAERMRQMRFLTARGFAQDVIRRVVRGDADEA